jgi:hypothetical protein
MNQNIDIKDIETITLTDNGEVVGIINVRRRNDTLDFLGRAVYYQNRNDFSASRYHGFGCGMAITADNREDIASVESFLNALKVSA